MPSSIHGRALYIALHYETTCNLAGIAQGRRHDFIGSNVSQSEGSAVGERTAAPTDPFLELFGPR